MISINQWFNKNTNRPLNIIFLVSIVMAVFLGGKAYNDTKTLQLQTSKEVSQILSLSIMEKERRIIEAILNTVMIRLNAKSAAICEDGITLSSIGSNFNFCSDNITNFLVRDIYQPITGYEDIYLKIRVPVLNFSSLGILIVFLAGMIIIIKLIIKYIVIKFNRDILLPLEKAFVGSEQVYISEIQEIIAQRKKIESSQRQEAALEAVLLNNRKIAHNIKSPLSVLKILTYSLRDSLDAKRGKIFDSAVQSIDAITNDLYVKEALAGDIGEYGTTPLEKIDIYNCIQEVYQEKKSEYVLKSHIEILFKSNIENNKYFCATKKYELKSIISNLINNSVDAIEDNLKNEGRILCELDIVNKDTIKIAILDNGVGMSESVKSKIFAKDYTTKKTGTGFGLFHAKKLMESWGGSINFTSQPDEGTSFSLTLPTSLQ